MELPLFPSPRSDALRLLAMAGMLLEARDLVGSRSLAHSARDADPSLFDADRIIAIADTLLGAERRLDNNQTDWLAVLQLTPLEGLDAGLVSGRFTRLRSLLDPHTNRHPLAEEAFNLINEAYPVLTNPSSTGWRSLFDAHFGVYSQQPPPQQLPDPFNAAIPALPQNLNLFGGGGVADQQQLVQGGQSSDGVGGTVSVKVHNFMGLPSGLDSDVGSGSSTSGSGRPQLHNFLNEGGNAGANADVEVVAEEEDEDNMGSLQPQFYLFF